MNLEPPHPNDRSSRSATRSGPLNTPASAMPPLVAFQSKLERISHGLPDGIRREFNKLRESDEDSSKLVLAQSLCHFLVKNGLPADAEALRELALNSPPVAKQVPEVFFEHGGTRTDYYTWLHDLTTPEAKQYLANENAHTALFMADTEALQESLLRDIAGHIPEEEETIATQYGAYYYSGLWRRDNEYPIMLRRHGSKSAEPEVILDVNELARDQSYFEYGGYFDLTHDQRLMAYGADTVGNEHYDLYLKDLLTGESVKEITDATCDFVLTPDGKYLFYSKADESERPYKVYRHRIGSDQSEDQVVFYEPDQTCHINLSKSLSGRFLFISTGTHTTNEVHVLDLDDTESAAKLMAPKQQGVLYDVAHHEDRFIIRTNIGGAKDYKIVECPVATPGPENWKDLLPYDESHYIKDFDVFRDHVVTYERVKGRDVCRVLMLSTGESYELPLPRQEESYGLGGVGLWEFDRDRILLHFGTLVSPTEYYEFDLTKRELTLVDRDEVPGFEPEKFEILDLNAKARDGKEVPLTVALPRDRSGPIPIVVMAYGAYGNGWPDSFDDYASYATALRVALLENGFGFAMAHPRGGDELGQAWWEEGKFLNKQNTFSDVIACGEHLIERGLTTSEQLGLVGRSAGGTMATAVANQRPELFSSVIAGVPFVDAVTTMSDQSMPLVQIEYEEWGNPAIKEQYEAMLAWSPYDQVRAQGYPHMMLTAGLDDPRVDAREPVKMVAKLRDLNRGDTTILLSTTMGPGHSGASGRLAKCKDTAVHAAFFLKTLADQAD